MPPPCPVTGIHSEGSSPDLLTSALKIFVYIDKVPLVEMTEKFSVWNKFWKMNTLVVIQAKLFTYKPRFFLWRLVMLCKKRIAYNNYCYFCILWRIAIKRCWKNPRKAPKRQSYKMKGMEIKAKTKPLELWDMLTLIYEFHNKLWPRRYLNFRKITIILSGFGNIFSLCWI